MGTAAAPAGRARQGRDSLEHKVTLTQNDSSSAGLFWAVPGAGCVQTPRRKLGSGEDVSNQPQPPRFILSRGGSAGAEPGLCVGAASGTQPRPRAGVVAPGSGEAAGQQGWPGRSSWSITSRSDTALGVGRAPNPSSPAPKLHPLARGSPGSPARPVSCGQPWPTRLCCSRGAVAGEHRENLIAEIPQPEGLRGIRELQMPDKRMLE